MSGKTTDEAETAFIHSGPSKAYSHSSTGLYVQNESVNFPTTSTARTSEDAPLLSTVGFSSTSPTPFLHAIGKSMPPSTECDICTVHRQLLLFFILIAPAICMLLLFAGKEHAKTRTQCKYRYV